MGEVCSGIWDGLFLRPQLMDPGRGAVMSLFDNIVKKRHRPHRYLRTDLALQTS